MPYSDAYSLPQHLLDVIAHREAEAEAEALAAELDHAIDHAFANDGPDTLLLSTSTPSTPAGGSPLADFIRDCAQDCIDGTYYG